MIQLYTWSVVPRRIDIHWFSQVRAISLCNNSDDLREVYAHSEHSTTPLPHSVCHMSDSDSFGGFITKIRRILRSPRFSWQIAMKEQHWLVVLCRRGNEWCDALRVQIEALKFRDLFFESLADSRMVVGQYPSNYLEMFRVESDLCIAHVHRIRVPEEFTTLTANCDNEILIAMSYANDKTFLVNQLNDRFRPLWGSCAHSVELSK